jgi:hypothetical protein
MPETAVAPDFAAFAGSPPPNTTLSRASAQIRAPLAPPRLRRNAIVVAAIAIVALAIVVIRARSTADPTVGAAGEPSAAEPSSTVMGAVLPAESAPAPPVIATSTALATSPAPTIITGTTTRRAPTPAPAGEDAFVHVDFPNARDGIAVTLDGRPAKLPLRIPKDNKMHAVKIQTPHFEPETLSVKGDADQSIRLKNEVILY